MDCLLNGWIEAVFVRSLRLTHHLPAFLHAFSMLLDSIVDLAISRSLILFRYFLQAFQKRWINVNRKPVCLHTGSISLLHLCVNGLQYPCAQAPNKERPVYPYALKVGGLRAGLITNLAVMPDLLHNDEASFSPRSVCPTEVNIPQMYCLASDFSTEASMREILLERTTA
jgi:hypothetical protein